MCKVRSTCRKNIKFRRGGVNVLIIMIIIVVIVIIRGHTSREENLESTHLNMEYLPTGFRAYLFEHLVDRVGRSANIQY